VSSGPDDKRKMRARIERAFDRFIDVSGRSDRDVAALLRELEVDIAVDLNGHTQAGRLGIFAYRPAPIQVNYLGYPGTTGADFMDYVIADPIVLPADQQRFYSERIVCLPESYQVNDSKREIAAAAPSRNELGLPERGIVFCCFNGAWKITAPMFEIWMRLLREVESSVLWLLASNELAMSNLRAQAQVRGVSPERLVFAPFVDAADHLARLQQADLVLDTLPYNAHTTGSDALWVGVPLLTCCGTSFAGRVGASLLNAVGLPELITNSLSEYENAALMLARDDPSRLQSIRRKLAEARHTCPLFDTDRFRRGIEIAYKTMWDIFRRGDSPRSFSVNETG
jgi:protein O-GlcNAc transferase